jgi:hypothetical protein
MSRAAQRLGGGPQNNALLADLKLRPPYNAERASALARLSDSEFLVNPASLEGLSGLQFANDL